MKPAAIVALVVASLLMLLIIVSCAEFSVGMNRGLHEGSARPTVLCCGYGLSRGYLKLRAPETKVTRQ